MYSKLQNVNKVFLDSRLGPTLSCLVAEKVKFPDQLLFCHNNKVKLILVSSLILGSRPPDLSPGLDSTQAWTQIWGPGLKDQFDFVVGAEK